MRTAYREHLEAYASDLRVMSETVRAIMSNATTALLETSLDNAEEALSLADSLKEIRERCEHRSMELLALQNPVASELRQVITSIHIVEDFNRMGALAKHIANTARLRHPREVVPADLRDTVADVAKLVDEMAELIDDQLISPDADLALEVNRVDDQVDALHRFILSTVTANDWEESNRAAVDLALVGRFYERYADHCVNVASRIVFLVTGQSPEDYADQKTIQI
ncbi:phosphate signaling complex protein PhoU [Corynebacterium aquatimens]|uniref:Phosphate transport system protein n=1 Tax=Corynebacterium aquatimens TaxID=1190508 RepID=A0A931GW91_9CORY|nr:phosphate signaling complex protein PhoU [Corynebacterium aquatimens]MBG6122281.1 phosphate transport system protein [Corynebacterium aquatimens]WJY65178.1 hypothetical protein CAQUA_02230 [Corynebacterium aquatimens]